MKEGFYLSPDGLVVVEVIQSPVSSILFRVCIPISSKRNDTLAILFRDEIEGLFSAWEVLE